MGSAAKWLEHRLWSPMGLGSGPRSATYSLCDLRKVPSALGASVSSSVKWGLLSAQLPSLFLASHPFPHDNSRGSHGLT